MQLQTSRRALIVASVALTALAGCSRIPDTVKIGVAQPLTGPIADLGADMRNGVQLAVNELNANGFQIKGKPVKLEVVVLDDKSDPETGKQVAEQLVAQGVVAVVGHLNSGVSIPAAPIYAKHHIPQLAISTKPEYTQQGFPTTLRLVANDAMQSRALGSFAVQQLNGQKYALLDDGTPYGKTLADLTAKTMQEYRKPPVYRKSFNETTTDFASLVADLKSNEIDVVVLTLSDAQVVELAKQAAAAGLTSLTIVGGDTIKTDKLPAQPLPVKGIYATTPILDLREFRNGKEFARRFREAYNSDPVYGAHYAYDAVHLLANTMKRAESVDPKVLTEHLRKRYMIAPVTETMRFREDGEQVDGVVAIYRAERGRWELMMHSSLW